MMLNPVQKAAYELIQSDARFLYTLTVIQKKAKNISSNYIMMSQPYIGLFADGAEQWCGKVGLVSPKFTAEEKKFYTALRQNHKLYEMSYADYYNSLRTKLYESDAYFYSKRRLREILFGYYNVGTDLCNGEFCGNTVLCALYMPVNTLSENDIGPWFRDISVVAGKLAAFLMNTDIEPYIFNDNASVIYKDYHFYKNCPIKTKTDIGFLLFSILCSVNYAIEFIDKYFIDEIPQKFKFAYLQYYYLCDFIAELNLVNNTNYYLNDSLKDRSLRNCLAHYGLGQYLSDGEIISEDPLKGLTNKAFNMDYVAAKNKLYAYLKELTSQIKASIL